MLSDKFQADIPSQMYVYPVLPKVVLPDAFVKYAQIASQPATLVPADIAVNRDAWIQNWGDAVLK
jgi:thiamine transport system substrate-binding protein